MNSGENINQMEKNSDNTQSTRPIANVGKRFYTWATMGTFAGASFLVGSIWAILNRLDVPSANSEIWPLIISTVIIIAFAFATEPEHKTLKHQKFQKALITIGNILLVYFAVVGGTTVVTQITGG